MRTRSRRRYHAAEYMDIKPLLIQARKIEADFRQGRRLFGTLLLLTWERPHNEYDNCGLNRAATDIVRAYEGRCT